MLIMLVMPAWAMLWSMFNPETGWLHDGKWLLFAFGCGIMALQVWMVIEAALLWPRACGVIEEALPPLPGRAKSPERDVEPALSGTGGSS